jgi:hypothetical protein
LTEEDIQVDENWVSVIKSGEKAIYNSRTGPTEVSVLGYRYTPHGLMYELKPLKRRKNYDVTTSLSKNTSRSKKIVPVSPEKWIVSAKAVQPIPGQTEILRVNLLTGESKPL